MCYDMCVSGYTCSFWTVIFIEYFTVLMFMVAAIIVLKIMAFWKIFEKAGQKGWYSLIPFYDSYKMFEIVFGNGWDFLLMFVPFVNFIAGIVLSYQLGKVFGRSTGFCLGLVFFPYIFSLILGFGDSEYVGLNEKM